MPSEAKDKWSEVGNHFTELGNRLAERYRALGAESSEGAEEGRKKIEDAVKAMTQQLDRTLTSVGDTMRDPSAKESLDKAMSTLGSALSATFSEVGEEIQKRFRSRGGSAASAGSGADPGNAPPPPSEAEPEPPTDTDGA
jgi:hypothetical protein